MDAEPHLVDLLEDLRRRTELRASAYEIAQAAGLLRRLLLDPRSVIKHLDPETRKRLTCRWSRLFVTFQTDNGPVLAPMLWLDPELAVLQPAWNASDTNQTLVSGTLSQFLQYPVFLGSGRSARVKDLILHYAHREGGVHLDERPAKIPVIDHLKHHYEDAPKATMVAVGRIIARTLEPVAARLVMRRWPGPLGIAPANKAATGDS